MIKSFGLVLYLATLTRCANPLIYIIMNGVMCLSTANSARYEFQHYLRYGTVFRSIHEYDQWKASLWPNTRLVFSLMEFSIKIWYFIYAFPPRLEFSTACDAGKSIYIIHVLAMIFVYVITCICTSWLYCWVCFTNEIGIRTGIGTGIRTDVSRPMVSYTIPLASPTVPASLDKECCICLDNEESSDAASAKQWLELPCGHMFHQECVSRWLFTHDTCPVCRLNVRIVI